MDIWISGGSNIKTELCTYEYRIITQSIATRIKTELCGNLRNYDRYFKLLTYFKIFADFYLAEYNLCL
jgi:hypothetical protein